MGCGATRPREEQRPSSEPEPKPEQESEQERQPDAAPAPTSAPNDGSATDTTPSSQPVANPTPATEPVAPAESGRAAELLSADTPGMLSPSVLKSPETAQTQGSSRWGDLDQAPRREESLEADGENSDTLGRSVDMLSSSRSSVFGSLRGPRRSVTYLMSETPDSPSLAGIERKVSHVTMTSSVVKGEDEDGNKTINEYAVIAELGRGSYGKVKLVLHTATEKLFAIKIMNKSVLSRVKKDAVGEKTALDDVLQEIAIMKRLDHPNVVRLHEVINDPASNKLYLILDYLERGPVYVIGSSAPMRVDEIRKHLKSICQGLDYLHQLGITHKDIKPDNILVDSDGVCRLTDFGVSHIQDLSFDDGEGLPDDCVVNDTQGTPAFLTPEQTQNEPLPGRMQDLWALGVTVFVMSTARLPFRGDSWQELSRSISEASPDYSDCPCAELEDLLRATLHRDLSKRLGNEGGVRDLMRHKFLGMRDSRKYSMIRVTAQERMAAVKTGHNIVLRMQGAISTMMKIDRFRRRTLSRRVSRLGDESPGASVPVSPAVSSVPDASTAAV